MVAALGGLLFGYDTAVIAGAIGFLEIHFHLDAAMTGWAASSALCGCMAGVLFAGAFSDKMGRKRTLVVAGCLFLAGSLGSALPREFSTFVWFRILGGIGVGIASMASPMYIAEIAPARFRGRLVSVNQFAIISGMVVIYLVNYAIARHGNDAWRADYSWRWMFASGILPSAVFLVLLAFVPESPRWLFEKGRRDEAIGILTKVDGPGNARLEAATIEQAIACESGSVSQLFAPGMRKALIIGISLAVLQQVTGINVFLYYAPEIFKRLGSGVDVALMETIVVGAVNLLFTVVAIWLVDRLGRKALMIAGSAGMGICLLGLGWAAQAGVIAAGLLVLVLGYIACFAISVGPVTWVILSEIFPTKIRGRALSIVTLSLWSANFVVSQTFPMMDGNQWLAARFHHGFPFYVYAVFCVVLVAIVWKLVPETKGRSLEEIEQDWIEAALRGTR